MSNNSPLQQYFRLGIFCDNVSAMSDSARHWNELHANPRFRPSYPNEDVVRFLLATRDKLKSPSQPRFLDIGAGGGRHMRLAAELGFSVCGVDISFTGLTHARERIEAMNRHARAAVASMTQLPFANETFEAVLSFGSFYYGDQKQMRQAIAEANRVLAKGGRSFTVLRTTSDYRYGKGRQLEPRTFQLDISETNELGTVQHFLAEENIPEYFVDFSRVSFEKSECTFGRRTRVNSDWLITAEK
ncbi:MAG TPA: methyltransferase domain-containing protein [Terriglobales bacterium]|nr:methyltransferase domain-containing protein [Terriglobales bacterium]